MGMTSALPKTMPQWAVAILFGISVFFLGTFMTKTYGMDDRLHKGETWMEVHDERHEQIMEKLERIEQFMNRK